jgi:hypothetical protein
MSIRNKIPLIIACIVGFISIAPYIIMYSVTPAANGVHEKFHYFYQDSELVYLLRIREVLEGNISIASPVFAEYKNIQNVQQPFGEWIYAIGALGQTEFLYGFALFSKFLFPAILFYFVYLVVRQLVESYNTPGSVLAHTVFSVGVASFITLGYDFTNAGFWNNIFSDSQSTQTLSLWTRLVNPITGALGFFISSYLILTLGQSKSQLRTIFAGVILGAMTGYYFSFMITVLGYIVLMGIWFFTKKRTKATQLFFILLIAFLINLPYYISLLFVHADIVTLTKSGMLLTHAILHNKTLYIGIGIFLTASIAWRLMVCHWKVLVVSDAWQWSISMFIASLIVLNEQVITGKTIWPGHFVQYIFPITFTIVLVTLYVSVRFLCVQKKQILYRIDPIITWLGIAGIIFVLSVNTYTAVSAYAGDRNYTNEQRYVPAVSWIRDHGGDHCVVFVLEYTDHLEKFIPAYTQCDLYASTYTFSGVPDDRVLHNYIVKLRLLGVDQDSIDTHLREHARDINRYFFKDWVDIFPGIQDIWIKNTKSQELTEAFIPETQSLISRAFKEQYSKSTHELLTQYRINYIIVDEHETSTYDIPLEYEQIFESNGVRIFLVQ